jgi:Lhr-like helicase
MDKKDIIAFFHELRLFYGKDFLSNAEKISQVEKLFENYDIDKLDIKRMYRYLDKNVKKEVIIEDDDSSDYEE